MADDKFFRTADIRVRIEPWKLDKLKARYADWSVTDIVHHLIDNQLQVDPVQTPADFVIKDKQGYIATIPSASEFNAYNLLYDCKTIAGIVPDFRTWIAINNHYHALAWRLKQRLKTTLHVIFEPDNENSLRDITNACHRLLPFISMDDARSAHEDESFELYGWSYEQRPLTPTGFLLMSESVAIFSEIGPSSSTHGLIYGNVPERASLFQEQLSYLQWMKDADGEASDILASVIDGLADTESELQK